MKTIVKVIASTFLISSAYVLTPVYAYADATPSSAAMAKEDAKRDTNVEKHISKLHAKLKITADEESQWAEVAEVIHANANALDEAIDKREALNSSSTAVDDLNAYAEIAQTHADGIKKLVAAFTPLYDSMPEAQKKLADEVFFHHMQKEKHKHKMMH